MLAGTHRGRKVEAAYRRGDLFEKRRRRTEAWAAFGDASTKERPRRLVIETDALFFFHFEEPSERTHLNQASAADGRGVDATVANELVELGSPEAGRFACFGNRAGEALSKRNPCSRFRSL